MLKSHVLLDDKTKKITPLNRNYFYICTVFIVLLNIIVYAVHQSNTGNFYVKPDWGNFSISNLFQALVNTYTHSNWQHTLLNMLCFFIAGLYLERKQGSLKFLIFIFIMSLFTAFASCTNDVSLWWHGFSGVNYGLYGYIIIEFVFTVFQKNKRDKFNIIFGVVILALIYLAMCFNGGTQRVSFAIYPYDLLHNLGHASGFAVGIVFSLYEQICEIINTAKQKSAQ